MSGIFPTVDYAKLYYQQAAHHERYVRHVNAMPQKLTCQECGGAGGRVEPVLDFGEGPFEHCGFCEGTGLVTRWMRGRWLLWRRAERKSAA